MWNVHVLIVAILNKLLNTAHFSGMWGVVMLIWRHCYEIGYNRDLL